MRSTPFVYAAAILLALVACDDDSSSGPPADVVGPDAVTDLSAVYVADGAVELTWTAPGDGLGQTRADRYEVRVAYADPFEWNTAAPVSSPPDPGTPGSTEHFTVSPALRGRDFSAEVRALDAAGNLAPGGSIASVRTPGLSLALTCRDAISDAPIAGLDVLVTDLAAHVLATDAAGFTSASDLAEGTLGLRIETGVAPFPVHRLVDAISLTDNHTGTYELIAFEDPASPLYDSILELLLAARLQSGGGTVLKKWHSYPIAWSAPTFVNGLGVDYYALTQQAAARWNERTGMELFVEVASTPAIGVELQFLSRSEMGIQNGITEPHSDAQGFPDRARIRIVDDFAPTEQARLYSILMHEFGHALGLGHLPDGFIMYAAQPLPADISDDEAAMMRLLVSLPNPVDLSIYDPAPPE